MKNTRMPKLSKASLRFYRAVRCRYSQASEKCNRRYQADETKTIVRNGGRRFISAPADVGGGPIIERADSEVEPMCGRFTRHYTWQQIHEFLSVFGGERDA